MSKRNRLSNVRILILTLETVLILGAFFVFKGRLDTEAAHSALNSGEETAFQRISFYVANKGQAFMIKAHRDVTVNPSKYYVFLPSCARNADIFVYYEFRDCLEILDGSGFNERIKNGDRLPNVELKKEYDMVFTDSDGSVMERTKVSFYNSDNTPSIFIDTLSGSMEYLDSDKGNSEKGKILILDSDGKTEYKGRLEEIKGHGNSTWQRAKKPYAFKLYKEENLFNMGSSKNWVLLSNSMDKSMARNSLIADAARDLNLPASPKMCYADIYLNGSYNGLYLLSTKTEIGKGRIDITDLDRMNKLVNIIPPAGS